MQEKIVAQGITFDDVLLVPAKSDVVPRDVNTHTKFTRNIETNIPLCSAAMDTVTEAMLAIALAQEGGIGIIHRNLTIEAQAKEVESVKRSESGVIFDPITLPPDETIGTARQIMNENHISGVPIVKDGGLVGILTNRDLRFHKGNDRLIAEIMTKDNLITAATGTTLEEAKGMLHRNKVEKLLLVDDKMRLQGLITIKDINKTMQFPQSCKDERGRLRVGAAVGVDDIERAEALVNVGVDVVVVDTAHGHSSGVIDTVKRIKKKLDVDVVAGNVATTEGAADLIKAGVDGVKVGIGPGSICTTRVIAGVGVPQLTAIYNCRAAAEKAKVPVIADGGVRNSGDITKAIATGANSVMMGSLFAGLAEAPGETIIYRGRTFKAYRGMGSLGAMVQGSKERYRQGGVEETQKLVPEGVEGRVPFKGSLGDFVYQLVGGLRAGMGYCGAQNIEELHSKARFVSISSASLIENHPHDIFITREAPNYRAGQPFGSGDDG